MSQILVNNASVSIPIYDHSARKLFSSKKIEPSARVTGGNRAAVSALVDVNLDLISGQRLGIVGPNGAGKTTLLRLLSGIYYPTSGSIEIKGNVSSLLDIALGFEPDLTGLESVYLKASLLGLRKKRIDQQISRIVDFAEIGEFMSMPTRTYSSGMLVRLAFSVLTSMEPQILIMDEWLSVGDESFRKKAQDRLQQVVDSSDILVLASHSRRLIEATCTDVLWLEDGKIKEFGPPRQVCASYFGPHRA